MNFFIDYWRLVRPYLLRVSVDFTVSTAMYLGLFLFKVLRSYAPIEDWAGDWFVTLHSIGALAAVVIFLWYAIVDIIQVHKGA